MKDKTLRHVGIICGGNSGEREVSLNTGKAVKAALQEKGISHILLEADSKLPERLLEENVSVAFLALHGTYGEDGCIQGLLEYMKIPYTGSSLLSSAQCFDKALTREILQKNALPVPNGRIISNETDEGLDLLEITTSKLVVKPSTSGSSVGITIQESNKDHTDALQNAFKYSNRVVIEEFLPGREFTVPVYQNSPIGVMEIIPSKEFEFYDYASKYEDGGSYHDFPAKIPAGLAAEMMDFALAVHNIMGCHFYSRVDFKLDEQDRPFLLEINTLPGLTATSLFPEALSKAGISFDEMLIEIIKNAKNFIYDGQ